MEIPSIAEYVQTSVDVSSRYQQESTQWIVSHEAVLVVSSCQFI